MRLFRRKKQDQYSSSAAMKQLEAHVRALAELAQAHPEQFDGPLEDEHLFPKSEQPPVPVTMLEHICSSSVEKAHETDAAPIFSDWAEATAKSAAIALMRLLDNPGHLLGAIVLRSAPDGL